MGTASPPKRENILTPQKATYKGGKPALWLSMLSTLCHFHGLLFARQVLEKPMCSRRVQFATFGARCSSAPHRLSLSALAIRLRIETTSQAIHMSELPVLRPFAEFQEFQSRNTLRLFNGRAIVILQRSRKADLISLTPGVNGLRVLSLIAKSQTTERLPGLRLANTHLSFSWFEVLDTHGREA